MDGYQCHPVDLLTIRGVPIDMSKPDTETTYKS